MPFGVGRSAFGGKANQRPNMESNVQHRTSNREVIDAGSGEGWAQRLKHLLQVRRQRGGTDQPFPAQGMGQGDRPGMEKMPPFGQSWKRIVRRPVEAVPDDRVTATGQVDPNLVRDTRDQFRLD
jgi:hypothetical protein